MYIIIHRTIGTGSIDVSSIYQSVDDALKQIARGKHMSISDEHRKVIIESLENKMTASLVYDKAEVCIYRRIVK